MTEPYELSLTKLPKFKTGGMRGVCNDDISGINNRICYVLATVLALKYDNIVIGFDHRLYDMSKYSDGDNACQNIKDNLDSNFYNIYSSEKFACIFDMVFKDANKSIVVYRHCTTPYLAYESQQYSVGVMITASHNSKEYNGFKVYVDGAQINEPLVSEIEKSINNKYISDMTNIDGYNKIIKNLKDWKLSTAEINFKEYFKSFNLNNTLKINQKKFAKNEININFYGLYGVSGRFMKEACKYFGMNINLDSDQNKCDPNFNNIKYPNPEVVENYKDMKGNIIFTADPDGDRFGLAFRNQKYNQNDTKKDNKNNNKEDNKNDSNELITVLNGNEIAKIFLFHLLKNFESSEIGIFNTFLCSDRFELVAKKLNICHVQTETGFKNVSKAIKDQSKNRKVPFKSILAYEDSLGFIVGGGTEKDGIRAAVAMYFIIQNYTIEEMKKYLDVFGQCCSFTVHFRSENPKILLEPVIEKISNFDITNNKINHNMTNSKLVNKLNIKSFEIKKDMIIINIDNFKIILRISGTEPLVKIYAMSQEIKKEELIELTNGWIKEYLVED